MAAKNLCKRCALSGTLACPPGYVRNSVSTSEGIVSCSGFVPKPMVPRRREGPNLQNAPPYRTDPEFIRDLREMLFQRERDNARAEINQRLHADNVQLRSDLETMTRERDALRKALLNTPINYEKRDNSVKAQISGAVERVKRECDRSRRELDYRISRLQFELKGTRWQRDKALKQVEKLSAELGCFIVDGG
jgi:hypothetical protein